MLTNQTLAGRILRLPLRLVPKDATVTVLSGLTRGMKWRAGSSVHGCWIGTYELAKQRAIREIVRPGMNVWDIGANVGYYTLGFAALGARVWAFEPFADNIADLERHIAINGMWATVLRVAASDRDGVSAFTGCGATGHLSDTGGCEVHTVTLDGLNLPRPDVVKIDVEGAELAVLRGAARLIAERKTIWLVALDDPRNAVACRDLFAGHSIRDIGPGEIMCRPKVA